MDWAQKQCNNYKSRVEGRFPGSSQVDFQKLIVLKFSKERFEEEENEQLGQVLRGPVKLKKKNGDHLIW